MVSTVSPKRSTTTSDGILSVIGNTPLVQLRRIFAGKPMNFYAKLEALNPGGSIKDRAAIGIVNDALRKGLLQPGATVIESSSGNMGIGLSQACRYLGLRFICVIDPKATSQNVALIRAYGAQIELVSEPDPETGEYLHARLKRVKELLAANEGSFWPDQYSNVSNSMAHHQTMKEIVDALDGNLDAIFCSASTFGTVRGCAEHIRAEKLRTRVYAVDAVGSVIFGGQASKRIIPGHGAAIRPELYQDGLVDGYVHVSDLDCVVGCRRLVRHEAMMVGGSSGGTLMAVGKMLDEIPDGSTCVAIFPDRGERYLDTIYSDPWVENTFGDVSHLWLD